LAVPVTGFGVSGGAKGGNTMEKPAPLGYGLGLRPVYYDEILASRRPIRSTWIIWGN
jgi:hypothetical protein